MAQISLVQAAPMLNQVLETEEWRTDIGFRPIEENTTCIGNQDIASVQVEMAQRIGNAGILEFFQGEGGIPTEGEKFVS